MTDLPTTTALTDADAMLNELAAMRRDQICLKNLRPNGWTIATLCDLLIDRPQTIPLDLLQDLEGIIQPDWIASRRAERAQTAVANGLAALTREIQGLRADLAQLRSPAAATVPVRPTASKKP